MPRATSFESSATVRASFERCPAVLRAVVALAVLVVLGPIGCRPPDPVYDRIPRPIGTRDVVRAERRIGEPLDREQRLRVFEALDRHQAAFDVLRETEIVPFAAEFRGIDPSSVRNDERLVRGLVGKHRAILQRIRGLDEDLFDDVADALGPDGGRFVLHLRTRRTIDRASILGLGDAGRPLDDLRLVVDALKLPEADRARLEPILAAHELEATALAERIADEQATLPLRWIQVVERRGQPRAAAGLDGSAARQSRERAEQERFAESRRELETLLFAYADLVDRSVATMAEELDDDTRLRLERRVARRRIDDEHGRSADQAAFEALVAAAATDVPRDVRTKIDALRRQFLEEDAARFAALLADVRGSRRPGDIDGTQGAGDGVALAKARQARQERIGDLDTQRREAAKRFRDEVRALLPQSTIAAIEGLANTDRLEFTDRLASIVGSGRAGAIAAQRPNGYGDRVDRERRDREERTSGEPGELRAMLANMPTNAAFDRVLEGGDVDASTQLVLRDALAAWRERWEATREPMSRRIEPLMQPVMLAMNEADGPAFDRAAARLIGTLEEMRRERELLDAELLQSIDAIAGTAIDPARRELWILERAEAHRRLRFNDLPGDELLRLPSEATVPFVEAFHRQVVDRATATLLVAALAPFSEELASSEEDLRREVLRAVRGAVVLTIEGRRLGLNEEAALSMERPEARRVVAPARAAAERVVDVRLRALAAIGEALPLPEARAMREAYVRSAYPRLIDDRRIAERAIRGLREDPAIDDERRAALDAILLARDAARDAALDRLLAWGRSWPAGEKPTADEIGDRDAAGRRHPQLAGVVFARDEADARALRLAMEELRPEERDRHRDLDAFFDEQIGQARWLD